VVIWIMGCESVSVVETLERLSLKTGEVQFSLGRDMRIRLATARSTDDPMRSVSLRLFDYAESARTSISFEFGLVI
jgi:hypothetical protein